MDHQWRVAVTSPATVRIHRVDDLTIAITAAGGGLAIEVRVPVDAAWVLEDLGLPGAPAGDELEPVADLVEPVDEPLVEDPAAYAPEPEPADVEPDDDDEPDLEPDLPTPPGPPIDRTPDPQQWPTGDLPHETPGPAHPAQAVIELREPTDRPACGTRSGIRQHVGAGERLCRVCEEEQAYLDLDRVAR